jgi:hypothetical protein
MRTFKVISPFKGDGFINLCCQKCGTEAYVPTKGYAGGLVIARVGMGLVMDPPDARPPDEYMPSAIQCRKCKTIWSSEAEDVREAV